MANEARVFAEGVDGVIVRQFTVADGTAIAKGSLLVGTVAVNRTGEIHASYRQRPLGFTTMSKEASDGRTEIGCQRTGVVDAYVDGNAENGMIAVLGSTANRVKALTENNISAYEDMQAIVGRFIENAADGELAKVALTLG